MPNDDKTSDKIKRWILSKNVLKTHLFLKNNKHKKNLHIFPFSICLNVYYTCKWGTHVYNLLSYIKNINTTGATSGAGTPNPSGAPEFTPRFLVGFVLRDL